MFFEKMLNKDVESDSCLVAFAQQGMPVKKRCTALAQCLPVKKRKEEKKCIAPANAWLWKGSALLLRSILRG